MILACSSLKEHVEAAQKKMGTSHEMTVIDRSFHSEPETMKEKIRETIQSFPERYDTVLIAMGFCGGAWDHVSFDRTVVIPRTDDCVSLLLHTDDRYCPYRKEPGHLYLYENDPKDFSAISLMRDDFRGSREFQGVDPDYLFHMIFGNYRYMDIIDTGLNDCYSEEYVAAAQENADKVGAMLGYAEGSNRILEKLVSGKWDEQFLVARPGHVILHGDFFG